MFKIEERILKSCLLAALMSVVLKCDVATAKFLTQIDMNPIVSQTVPKMKGLERTQERKSSAILEEISTPLIAARRDVNNNGAATIIRNIDYSRNRCEDFYQFACGKWIKKTVLPDDDKRLDTFKLLQNKVQTILKRLLEEEDKPTDLSCVNKTKDFYKLCMNMNEIDSAGGEPLNKFIIEELGGWPLTTPCWSEDNFDFVQTMLNLNKYSRNFVFKIVVQPDFKNNTRNAFTITQPSLGMPGQKYYLKPRNDTMLMAYEDLIFQVGQLLCFADPNTARQEVADIVDFEIRLANISLPTDQIQDLKALYNPMKLSEVHGNYSSVFDWRTYVKSLLSKPEIGVNVTDDEVIINLATPYFQRLTAVLAATPKRTLVNYLIWRIIFPLLGHLGADYGKILQAYNKVVHGTSTHLARYKTCITLTNQYLPLVLARLYIMDNFDAESIGKIQHMVCTIKHSFKDLLDELDWMDEATKRSAKDKSDKVTSKIGYPEEVNNDTYMEDYHKNFTISNNKFLETVLSLERERFYKVMRQTGEAVDMFKWNFAPTDVSAYHNVPKNEMIFLAGILQQPFFNNTYPMSLNYGGLGSFIGHELTHGFDERGRNFDSTGTLRPWWNETTARLFKEKSDCFVQQYNNFTVPEINMQINGKNTLNENIADNGGLKQAFRAYRKWVRTQGREEPLLPGLDFNHDQLFFINYAQAFCTLRKKEDAIRNVQTSKHTPDRFRVIGAFQNSPDFARVFNCPLNSNMNPANKCAIW